MARKQVPRVLTKVVDEEFTVRCRSGSTGVFREEVFQDDKGNVIKYNLAFIHFGLCRVDHGRVLGYDNAHGIHERHWMGKPERIEFIDYKTTLDRFIRELEDLKEKA
ncbi:MAG TPA: DUF6516 family protein [Terracidiphilus sp.]|jgi:hypothetical protein|nr:DUF6516 family protein [Terracidiphilus sp.]